MWLAGLWNPKAKAMRLGRKHWKRKLTATLPPKKNKRYWFHCASLGEFEMARPVIEKIQIEFPEAEIIITFFSPSGYEQRQHFLCTGVFYLPYDTKKNARKWYEIVQPDVAIFVKYEFWLNYMHAGLNANCSMLAISVLFREGQFIFEPWAAAWKQQLTQFKRIFVQNKSSEIIAKEEELKNIAVAGDIRFDRVLDTVEHIETLEIIEKFKGESPLLVGGSTWPEEEKHLFNYLSIKSWPLGWKWIIAPHDIGEKHINDILDRFSDYYPIKLSAWEASDTPSKHKILVIDNMGLLSRIYRYADVAVIGGAWGKGLHNILEAAAFGMPILFGPKHIKFPEAADAIEAGFAYGVKDYAEFEIALNRMLGNIEWRKEASIKAKEFVKKNAGSTEIVMQYLRENYS
ncbi:MAG: 3-deoxy-D-manno-octulosonic acid transferase [Bacteroidia bacterium]|nr:3-deoxy-D-manno-octulosonic acid transferase [Bacteroidia bacterium]